jgi:hypothetical protein
VVQREVFSAAAIVPVGSVVVSGFAFSGLLSKATLLANAYSRAALVHLSTTSLRMGDTVRTRFLGSTRMAITTSRPCRTSNFPAFTTSKES